MRLVQRRLRDAMLAAAFAHAIACNAIFGLEPPGHGADAGAPDAATDHGAGGSGGSPLPPDVSWVKTFGGPGNEIALHVAVDDRDDVYVVGEFTESIDLGGQPLMTRGKKDGFVVKLDSKGAPLWRVQIGGPGEDGASGLAVDSSGHVLVTGSFEGTALVGDAGPNLVSASGVDAYAVLFDESGAIVWSQRWGGNGTQNATNAAFGAGAVIAGAFDTSMDFSVPLSTSGDVDGYVAWIDEDNSSARAMKGAGISYVNGLAIADNGDALLAGSFTAQLAPNYQAEGPRDGFFARFKSSDATGDPHIPVQFGGPGYDALRGVASDHAMGAFVMGVFHDSMSVGTTSLTSLGEADLLVARLDATGGVLWARSFGGVLTDNTASNVASNAQGELAFAGFSDGNVDLGGGPLLNASAGTSDAIVARLDAMGNHVSSAIFGGTGAEEGKAVAFSSNGDLHIVGTFSSRFDLAGTPLAPKGGLDAFVVKLAK